MILADPLISAIITLTLGALPIYVGILSSQIITRWDRRKAVAYGVAIGVLFASFFDLMKETAGLSTSTLRTADDFLNFIALGAGLLVFLLARTYLSEEDQVPSMHLLYLWALLGVGFHGVGEGMIIGYDFTTGATVVSLAQISSFSLHKVAEGFTIGVLLVEGSQTLKRGFFGGLLGGFPPVLGTIAGISGYPATLSTYFFAASVGATIYMLPRLVNFTGITPQRTIAGVFLGFSYMYLSGVLHQFA